MTENLREALITQWSHELYNSNIYATMSAYLKNKGFDKIAGHFDGQVSEERGHADLILGLLTDLNIDFYAPQIESFDCSGINTIVDLADAYLQREIITTDSLDEIKLLAMDDDCPVPEEFLRMMIVKQQNELEEALTFKDKADIVGSDWRFVLLWNESLS